jgi:hypothetical protein
LVGESFWRRAEFLSTQSGWIVSVRHTHTHTHKKFLTSFPTSSYQNILPFLVFIVTHSIISFIRSSREGAEMCKRLDFLLLLLSFRFV